MEGTTSSAAAVSAQAGTRGRASAWTDCSAADAQRVQRRTQRGSCEGVVTRANEDTDWLERWSSRGFARWETRQRQDAVRALPGETDVQRATRLNAAFVENFSAAKQCYRPRCGVRHLLQSSETGLENDRHVPRVGARFTTAVETRASGLPGAYNDAANVRAVTQGAGGRTGDLLHDSPSVSGRKSGYSPKVVDGSPGAADPFSLTRPCFTGVRDDLALPGAPVRAAGQRASRVAPRRPCSPQRPCGRRPANVLCPWPRPRDAAARRNSRGR
jgi:hypothetical protein